MSFCTAINCMDGRVQRPVVEYLSKRFKADFVDMITEPGPNRILAEGKDKARIESILTRCNISVEKHGSVGIAVAGHYDCAGNPTAEKEQRKHLEAAIAFLMRHYPDKEIIGLWLDENFEVHELSLSHDT